MGGGKIRPEAVQTASPPTLRALRLQRRKGLESPPGNYRVSSPVSATHRKLASCVDERRMSSGENHSCSFRSIPRPGSLAIQTTECVCRPPLPKQGIFSDSASNSVSIPRIKHKGLDFTLGAKRSLLAP